MSHISLGVHVHSLETRENIKDIIDALICKSMYRRLPVRARSKQRANPPRGVANIRAAICYNLSGHKIDIPVATCKTAV